MIHDAECVVELQFAGDSSGTPVEPLARACLYPVRPGGLIRQNGAHGGREIELPVTVGMGARERKKRLRGRM
jgi:hypothetical protein